MATSYGASSPEELETMLEDATVLRDPEELAALFIPGGGVSPSRVRSASARSAWHRSAAY